MQKFLMIALMLPALACGGSKGANSPASGSTCASAATSAAELIAQAQAGDMSAEDLEHTKGLVADTMAASCTDAQWSQESIDCFDDAKDADATQHCAAGLTDDQRQAMGEAVAKAISGHDEAPASSAPMPDDDVGGSGEEPAGANPNEGGE